MKFFFTLLCISCNVFVFAQPAMTGLLVPKFIQGSGTADPISERRVPYAHYVEVTGLTANATYKYSNRFTDNPTSNNNGFGNWIIANKTGNFTRSTSVSFVNPGSFGEFTTDNTGKVKLWLIGEPSIDTRFNPGSNLLYVRLLLNNGAGGNSVTTRLSIAADPIATINFGSANNNLTGTGLRSTAVPAYNAKDFVMLFDNLNGTGRPVAGTYVESDGVAQRSFNDPDPSNEGYVPFYALEVDGKDKTWGTIIPNDLTGGIQNISNYSLNDGSLLFATKKADSQWPTIPSGTVSTINPTAGLTPLVISGPELSLPVKLLSFKAVCKDKSFEVRLEWKTESEFNFSSFEVQQSVDGVRFEKLTSVPAKGAQSLYESDITSKQGAKYYRLKMIDLDGKHSYSQIVKSNCTQTAKFSAFPNPANSNISVVHESAHAEQSLSIMTMAGSLLQSKQLIKGSTQTSFDISKLVPGNYILVLKSNNQEVTNQLQFTKL